MEKRISKKDYYLSIARTVAQRSTCLRRQYGCVIIKNDEVIATGYNGSARGEENCCDIYEYCPRADKPHNSGDYSDCPSIHAEQNAMLSASRKDMIGATMYLFGFETGIASTDKGPQKSYCPISNPLPCPICMRMIKNAGIEKVITKAREIEV